MIRAANSRDICEIATAFAGLASHIRGVSSHPYSADLPVRTTDREHTMARRFVEDPACFALVAQIGNRTVGCIAGRIAPPSVEWSTNPDVGHISLIWVDPGDRRSGIARGLVNAAEQLLRTRGVELVELAVIAENTEANEMWRQLGYEPFRIFSSKRIDNR